MSIQAPSQIHPGKGLGFLTLGASLHNVLTRLKAQPQTYPQLDLAYSAAEPVLQPVVLTLPANGIRLRFDGPDQRLRLIEVLDFAKAPLSYKNNEVVRRPKSSSESSAGHGTQVTGPHFRHVYNRLFGPTYPGEYVRPESNSSLEHGSYVLSYPGVAFSFPLKHAAWSERCDFVSLLSSSAASVATSMSIFNGASWPEARSTLFTKPPPFPRSIALSGRNKEFIPEEIEEIVIHGVGKLEVLRRALPPFWINLGETTPQDLVAELGPPDSIYRKNDTRITIHGSNAVESATDQASAPPVGRAHSRDSNVSPAQSYTGESDGDSLVPSSEDRPVVNPECFYNYFHHGFDALVAFPTGRSPPFPGTKSDTAPNSLQSHLVVTKIILHANIPGSYPFNRHRRSRWSIMTGQPNSESAVLTSELSFDEISENMRETWRQSYANAEEEKSMQRGMVLNRGWGESPGSSIELLGGFEDNSVPQKFTSTSHEGGAQGLGNTQLFGFPGLLFEVLKNGTVSCLTVY